MSTCVVLQMPSRNTKLESIVSRFGYSVADVYVEVSEKMQII